MPGTWKCYLVLYGFVFGMYLEVKSTGLKYIRNNGHYFSRQSHVLRWSPGDVSSRDVDLHISLKE